MRAAISFFISCFLFIFSSSAQKQGSWIPLKISPSEADLVIAESGLDSGTIYTTDQIRVWRSLNHGDQWEEIFDAWTWKPEPMELFGASALKQHPQKPGTLYLGSQMYGIWWTEDYGKTWKNDELIPVQGIPQPNIPVNRIGISHDGKTILAGSARTTDNFAHWTVMPDITATDLGGYVFLKDGTAIATELGIFSNPFLTISRSTDGGKNWTELAKLTSSARIGEIPMLADKYEDLYIGVSENAMPALLKSTDKGDSWVPLPISIAPSGTMVTSLTYYAPSHTLYAQVTPTFIDGIGGIYSSTDGGLQWVKVENHPYTYNLNYVTMGPDNFLYSFSQPYGPQRFDVTKTQWKECPAGLCTSLWLNILETDSAGNLYAGSDKAGLHFSPDDGETVWKRKNDGIAMKDRKVQSILPSRDGNLVFISMNGKLLESLNGGPWKLHPNLSAGFIRNMQTDSSGRIYLHYTTPGPAAVTYVLYTDNKGGSWDTLSKNFWYFHVAWNGNIFAFAERGVSPALSAVVRSVDRGQHWDTLDKKLSKDLRFQREFRFFTDYKGTVYIGTSFTEIYFSLNNGDKWTKACQISDEYYPPNTYAINFDRQNRAWFTMSRDSSILVSEDGCKTFHPVANGFPYVESLRFMQRIVFSKDDIPYGLDNRGTVFKYVIPASPEDSILPPDTTTKPELPDQFLAEVFPNPFSEVISLNYSLPAPGILNVTLYDMLGRKLMQQQLVHEKAGRYSFKPEISLLPASSYIFRCSFGKEMKILKVIKY